MYLYSSNLVDTSQTSVFMYKDPLYIIEIKRNIYQSKRIYWLQVYHLCSPLCYLYYFWYKLSKNPRVSNEQGSVGWRGAATTREKSFQEQTLMSNFRAEKRMLILDYGGSSRAVLQ